jgi:hypothetical protein
MKWILSLLGSKLGPWLILGLGGVWTGSLGYTYLQGRHDGRSVCEAHYKDQQALRLYETLEVQQDHLELVIRLLEEEKVHNQELAQTLENKIHNKETIVKEKLREIPIEVAADCTIDYNAIRVHNTIADPTGDN